MVFVIILVVASLYVVRGVITYRQIQAETPIEGVPVPDPEVEWEVKKVRDRCVEVPVLKGTTVIVSKFSEEGKKVEVKSGTVYRCDDELGDAFWIY